MPIQLSGSGSITGVSTLTSLASLDVTGSVSVGGTLIYDDVTNIDSLGIVTARSDVHVGAGLSVTGISTFNDYLDINGDINIDGSQITYTSSSNQLKFADDAQLRFGADNDLRIYHSASNSYIDDAGAGDLYVRSNRVRIGKYTGEDAALFDADGAVSLYYNDNKKFETTTTGATLTGTLTASGTGGGAATLGSHLDLGDNQKVRLGASDDLDMYHDGTDTYIRNNTGQLLIRGNDIKLNNYLGTQTHAEFADGGLTTGAIDLSAISASISDTAVDVFVYDTRKDSDGGAWRKRTQHTSWYNETLGTATRGTRREFPAVAVIVATSTKVTIHDGDDPDLSMWMIFEDNAYDMINTHNISPGSFSLSAKNGNLLVGSINDNYGEANVINFISDSGVSYYSAHSGDYKGDISQRNDGLAQTINSNYGTLVHQVVNDVAMTVLPNAPVDSATGLPVPTIAVATDAGVSVIKDDGNVYDITYTNFGYTKKTHFTVDNKIAVHTDTNSQTGSRFYRIYEIPSADLNAGSYNNHTDALRSYGGDGVLYGYDLRYFWNGVGNWYAPHTIYGKDGPVFGEDNRDRNGIAIISENINSPSTGLVCGISTDCNTGWMQGDIKGVFLSDTDTTNVTGSEKIANHDFSADFSTQWEIANSASASYDATNDRVTVTSAGNYAGIQLKSASLPTLTAGKRYIMTVDIHSITNPIYFGVVSGLTVNNVNAAGVWTGIFTASNVTEVFVKKPTGVNSTFVLNSVSIREVEEDRSISNKGLQVFGTVTKSAVATGAELVSYSGWSSSNYLRQPYNSDLNFGTGNWCYMFWYNPNDAESGDVIFSRWSYNVDSNQGPRVTAYFNSGNLRVDTADASAGNGYQGHFGSDGTQDSNEWHCAVILRRESNLEIWINGVNYKTATLNSTSDGSYTDTNAILEIGHSPGSGSPEAGLELALFRVSATAPSPEQIKKIYEDEKHLFQENAKATLYGSSDAVTALAYDEDTELLHVGTSAGRSDFQGLRRINNTTTAVTTAISASDELIAEQ